MGGGSVSFARIPVWVTSLLYMACYVPYIVITRLLATTRSPELGRPLTGLEILPASLILSGVLTYLFVWLAGWVDAAHSIKLGRLRLPVPTRWTALSGLGTAFVLFTVPLSYTFEGVSIQFMQLLMRGDVLLIAPLVDLVAGRKVRWTSWVALVLAAIGILAALGERRGFHMPPLAWATVALYTVGYFVRLFVMTRVSKTGAADSVKRYFVEEKIVGIPVAILALAALSWLSGGKQGSQLGWGFVGVWSSAQLGSIAMLSVLLFVVSIFSALILLDKRENSYCVPLERSASILAGVIGSAVLAAAFGQKPLTPGEIIGAVLLVAAIAVLTLSPRQRDVVDVAPHPTSAGPDASPPRP
jgi:drug/metabolite transporter (DMT)-like permease